MTHPDTRSCVYKPSYYFSPLTSVFSPFSCSQKKLAFVRLWATVHFTSGWSPSTSSSSARRLRVPKKAGSPELGELVQSRGGNGVGGSTSLRIILVFSLYLSTFGRVSLLLNVHRYLVHSGCNIQITERNTAYSAPIALADLNLQRLLLLSYTL